MTDNRVESEEDYIMEDIEISSNNERENSDEENFH